jgi:hypothetical protein
MKPHLIAWLVLSALLVLPASGLGQSTSQTAGQSTIFPSLGAKAKSEALVWQSADVKQSSPTQKTVFQEPDPAPATIGTPPTTAEAIPSPLAGGETCPGCGRLLDHPILGTCGSCGPGRRLLCMLSPSNLFADRPGSPVYHEPWINRPFSVGVFAGPFIGSPLMDDWVGQQTGTLAGMRFGMDMDDDWGMELRLATANVPIYDSDAAIEAQLQATAGTGLPAANLAGTRNADQFLCDIDFLYYPWGDNSFRPFLLFGIGTDRIKFTDRLGTNYARILMGMPVGLGFKTHLNDWMIFRADFTDNMAFAGGSVFQSQHNFSITAAFEVRLGRSKIQYWPWNPGR